jgi:hypothetical protein
MWWQEKKIWYLDDKKTAQKNQCTLPQIECSKPKFNFFDQQRKLLPPHLNFFGQQRKCDGQKRKKCSHVLTHDCTFFIWKYL